MLCGKLLRFRRFATQVHKVIAEPESHTLIDPHFFEKKDIISRVQQWSANNATLGDI